MFNFLCINFTLNMTCLCLLANYVHVPSGYEISHAKALLIASTSVHVKLQAAWLPRHSENRVHLGTSLSKAEPYSSPQWSGRNESNSSRPKPRSPQTLLEAHVLNRSNGSNILLLGGYHLLLASR